jgi:hypothetical protein
MRIAAVALLLLIPVLLTSPACKDKETQPTTVELKLFSEGELPVGENISGLDVTVALGSHVTLTSSDAITASGVASTDSLLESNYSAPTATVEGNVRVIIISLAGFGTGEFATIKGAIVGENTPPVSDFNVTSFTAATIDGQELSGLTSSLTVDIY